MWSRDRTTVVLPESLRDRFNQLKISAGFRNSSPFLEYLMDFYALRGFDVERLVKHPSFFEHDDRARVIVGKLLLTQAGALEKKTQNCGRTIRIEVDKEVCVRFSRLARQEGFKKNADFLVSLLDVFFSLSELAAGRDPRCVQEDLEYLASHIPQAEKR